MQLLLLKFTKIMIRALLVKLLGSFGVDVPSEYVFGEGSDQEEEAPLPPNDRASAEPEGSPTAPGTVEEQVREISPERWDRLFRPVNPFETPNPRLWAERDREAAAAAAVHEWARNRGDPSLASLFLQPGSSQAEAAAAVLERALRNEAEDRGEPSGSHQLLEPEASQARASGSGTSSLPTTPEKPTNPRKRAREDSDEEEV
jgi:hypothetical protein